MSDTVDRTLVETASQKPPFYRDATVVKWLVQLGALAAVLFALFFLRNESIANLEDKGINTGFDFLSDPAGFQLSEGIDTQPDTIGRALWSAMVNTIRLAIAGILVATILGVLVGVARLSKNWMVHKAASVFIEYMRNIPLLVHIFMFFIVIAKLPDLAPDSGPINGWLHVSNKGVQVPRIFIADGFYQWSIFLMLGLIAGLFVKRHRERQQNLTGQPAYPVGSVVGTMALFGLVGWFLHPIFGWVGNIFGAIASVIDAIPQWLMQVALAGLAIAGAMWWIKRFLDSRRTPAGLAKLTDDDYFRMIFAGVAALLFAFFVFVLWPGFSSWIINSGRDMFEVLEDKFGNGRDGWPIDAKRPDITEGRFANFGPAGLNFSQGLAAIFFAIVLYTAAFIAEIVRGGILAVPKGQTEAAQAIGLKRSTMLRRVILPQAFRISLPPLGNQYLNLTKNTSLAIAVGYSDLVQVGQTIFSQTGKSLEVFLIWMLFYLACSLTISAVVNFFNVRLKIVER